MSNSNLDTRILLVEPVPGPHAPTARDILTKKGYRLTHVTTAKEAVAQARKCADMVILDYSGKRSGYASLCCDLRQECAELPILVLAAEGEAVEPDLPPNVLVLTPPYTARKLLNRVACLQPQPNCDVLRVGDVTLYIQRRCLRCRGQEHHLTPMQARLLEAFMRHPGEILSRRFLIKQVWDTDYMGDTRTLDVHIRWLRRALEDNPSRPQHIITVRGVGYRFQAPETFPASKNKA